MLLGIIKNETDNSHYYIHLENNELSFVHATKNSIKTLTKSETKDLIKTILSSNLTYKEKYNEYDVYIDEANNKRFFKNGKENFFMFLEFNGETALRYIEKIDKTKSKNKPKTYKIITKTITFTMTLSMLTLIPFADDVNFLEGDKRFLSDLVELNSNELVNLINLSPFLSKEEKEYLCNKTYFEFLVNHIDNKDREYYLRNSMNNLSIKYYDAEHFENAAGYYNPLHINVVNILDGIQNDNIKYQDVLTHEFIHATQDQNKYLYLMEATAEIYEYEFYNQPCDGYPDLVKRTKVLMEIIGPEPIIECVTNGDSTKLEESIKKYLPEKEADELLEQLCVSSNYLYDDSDNMTKTNEKIDKLLAEMYKNKTGNDIENDNMIHHIYYLDTSNRIYFNTSHKNYNKDYYLTTNQEYIDEINIDDILKSDIVDHYTYSTVEERLVDGISTKFYSLESVNEFTDIPLDNDVVITIYFKDNTIGYTHYNDSNEEWKHIERYSKIRQYEPSIYKKFPEQVNELVRSKEILEKDKSEAKWL